MEKILLKQLTADKLSITLPKELAYIILNSKSKKFYSTIQLDPTNINNIKIIISNIRASYYSPYGSFYYQNTYFKDRFKYSSSPIVLPLFFRNRVDDKSFTCFEKADKGYKVINKHTSNYNLIINPNTREYVITTFFKLPQNSTAINIRSKDCILQYLIEAVDRSSDLQVNQAIRDTDEEIFHVVDVNYSQMKIFYFTPSKFAHCVCNNINIDSIAGIKQMREMSFAKFFKNYCPFISEEAVNAYISYNSLLTDYDPNTFSIVTGADIVKYYNQDSFYKSTGELSNSCMRYTEKNHLIEFYSKNSNVSMIIFKPNGLDKIMGRALLWTTTDGEKIMDRIYTCDSKLISLFHKYAKDNNIINIYENRTWSLGASKKDLTKMSPGNWTEEYSKNYTVDLNYIPNCPDNDIRSFGYSTSRRISLSDSDDIPYMDNFKYINSVTKQASVNALKDFMVCRYLGINIRDQFVQYNNNNEVYHSLYVKNHGNKFRLRVAARESFPEIYEREQQELEPQPELSNEPDEIVSDVTPTSVEYRNVLTGPPGSTITTIIDGQPVTYNISNINNSIITSDNGIIYELSSTDEEMEELNQEDQYSDNVQEIRRQIEEIIANNNAE